MASTMGRILDQRDAMAAGVAQPSVGATSPWSASAAAAIRQRMHDRMAMEALLVAEREVARSGRQAERGV